MDAKCALGRDRKSLILFYSKVSILFYLFTSNRTLLESNRSISRMIFSGIFFNMTLIVTEFYNKHRKQGSTSKTSSRKHFCSSAAWRSDNSFICVDDELFQLWLRRALLFLHFVLSHNRGIDKRFVFLSNPAFADWSWSRVNTKCQSRSHIDTDTSIFASREAFESSVNFKATS